MLTLELSPESPSRWQHLTVLTEKHGIMTFPEGESVDQPEGCLKSWPKLNSLCRLSFKDRKRKKTTTKDITERERLWKVLMKG